MIQNPMNMEELLARARENDQDALAGIYGWSKDAVYKVIKVLIKDEDTVYDILQDTYVKAFTRLDQLQDADKLLPWLKMIASNTAKDWLKKSKPVFFEDISGGTEDSESLSFEEQIEEKRTDVNPELSMDEKETSRLVMEILDQLPEDQRMVIGMFYYEEMSVKDIAVTLGVSENTVKSRLSYGRKKIKEQVLDLEKRGTKLYNVAPFIFFLYLLRQLEGSGAVEAKAEALDGILSSLHGQAVVNSAVQSVTGETAKSATAVNSAAKTAAGIAGKSAMKAAAGTAAKEVARHVSMKAAVLLIAGTLGVGSVTGSLVKGVVKNAAQLRSISENIQPEAEGAQPEAEGTQSGAEGMQPETEDTQTELEATQSVPLSLVQGTWYTFGGLPYNLRVVISGTKVTGYVRDSEEPWYEREITDITKTDYGYYFHIGDYGYRMLLPDQQTLTLMGNGDPYSTEGYSGTDSLVRTKDY